MCLLQSLSLHLQLSGGKPHPLAVIPGSADAVFRVAGIVEITQSCEPLSVLGDLNHKWQSLSPKPFVVVLSGWKCAATWP